MAHEQFFYSKHIEDNTLIIDGDEHKHLSRVMRKRPGDTIWISDGKGTSYQAEILEINAESTICKIIGKHPKFGEPENRVSLAIGLIKPSHWEIMLEKAVELGVYDIYPLITRYTVVKSLKRERGAKIILSALKQSGRSYLPILHDPVPFKEFIQQKRPDIIYICDNQDDYPQLAPTSDPENYLVLIGPEGGFHPDEVALAIQHSAQPVLLTNRRLRTETACLAALIRLIV
ncbi:MAG: 16S rRNA (uracil(1498)-N(3))-methyltransferase [Candidatus Marinimicrobia bacterium]|nr:16S rRNA (uracil(1498)-N(3))-methyltransferase [Candidatus Neomarinimicrobiota bacterium]